MSFVGSLPLVHRGTDAGKEELSAVGRQETTEYRAFSVIRRQDIVECMLESCGAERLDEEYSEKVVCENSSAMMSFSKER